MRLLWATAILLMAGSGCSSQQAPLSPEKFQATIKSISSLATESALLANARQSGAATQHYTEEHAGQIAQKLDSELQQLQKPALAGHEAQASAAAELGRRARDQVQQIARGDATAIRSELENVARALLDIRHQL